MRDKSLLHAVYSTTESWLTILSQIILLYLDFLLKLIAVHSFS